MLCRNIVLLADIGEEIVKLQRFVMGIADSFPATPSGCLLLQSRLYRISST